MTTRRLILWWLYVMTGIILVSVLAPTLLSAPDTTLVLLGIWYIVAYGVWTWYFWLRDAIINFFYDSEGNEK